MLFSSPEHALAADYHATFFAFPSTLPAFPFAFGIIFPADLAEAEIDFPVYLVETEAPSASLLP